MLRERREPTKDGLLIKHIRKKLGLKQHEFAERIGTTQSTISNWETFRVRKVHIYWWKAIKAELGIAVKGITDGK